MCIGPPCMHRGQTEKKPNKIHQQMWIAGWLRLIFKFSFTVNSTTKLNYFITCKTYKLDINSPASTHTQAPLTHTNMNQQNCFPHGILITTEDIIYQR